MVAAADLPAQGAQAPVTLSSLPSRIPPQLQPGSGAGLRCPQRGWNSAKAEPPPWQPRGDGRASPTRFPPARSLRPRDAPAKEPSGSAAGAGGRDGMRREQHPPGSLRGAARSLLPPCRAAAKSRGGGGAAAARGSAGGAPPPLLYRREITRSLRGGRGGSGRPSSPRAWRRMSRSAPRSAPAAGTSLPSAPGGGGAEASSRSTMAGSAWRFFAPRISAALGGGRERRRSAPGPARTPPSRPPCRARGTPARRSRSPGRAQPAERRRRGRRAGTRRAPRRARLRGGCV